MAGTTFGEDFRNEMTGKAVMWGPAITGAVLAGPVGFVLGLAVSVVMVASGSGDNASPPADDQETK
jgi:hypothetical protein